MGVLFSVPWKKKTPGRPAERRAGERIRGPKFEPCFKIERAQSGGPEWQLDGQELQKLVKMGFAEADVRYALEYVSGDEILAIKMLRFAECAWVGNDTNTKLWQPDEQRVQKLVEMGFTEAAVGSALEAVNGDEILAIKMLCFAECGPAGIDTYRKLWQPDEQRVQKLVEMGFAEAAVRRALEAVNGDEILAIKMLHFAECAPDGINTYRKLWQPDEQRVQKLVEMGFSEAAVRSALEAVNGYEMLAIKMLCFAECAWAGNDTSTKLWQPDEHRVQELVGMGFIEAAVRSALEATNGYEILVSKMLHFQECAWARDDTNTKLWQPDEQQVQELVEMGFTEADIGSALKVVYVGSILAIKMLYFAECGTTGIDTCRKLWQPDEQRVQKLVEMDFAEAAVRRALEAVNGDELLAIKMLRFAECARAGNDTNTKLWQPDEQRVQKLVEIGFAEAAVTSALEAVNGDEILAIKMLRFAECARAGNDTNTKLWQPDKQQVQKYMKMGFTEAAVRSALEAVNGDEILAIKMLCFAECGPAGIYTYRKLWQPDEQRVQKLVEMGFTEAAVRSVLEAINGDEILAIKMLRFAECARAGNDSTTKLWQPDEQRVQKLVEMGFVEDAVRSALEAVNGDETLAVKMLRFAEFARVGNHTNTKLWQPDEQQVQKLVEMGFAEAAMRSALEAVNGDEILAVKMLRFAEFGPARINTYRKLWQPEEQRVQKLMEMGFGETDVRRALEAVNGDEILAIKMLRFAVCARAGNYANTKPDEQLVQKLVEMGFAEAAVRSALKAVNGDEIMAIKTLRFAECARAGNYANTKLWQPDEQQVQKLVEMGCDDAAGRKALEAPVRSALEAVNGHEFWAIEMLLFAERARARNDANRKQVQNLLEMGFAEAAVEVLLRLFICYFLGEAWELVMEMISWPLIEMISWLLN